MPGPRSPSRWLQWPVQAGHLAVGAVKGIGREGARSGLADCSLRASAAVADASDGTTAAAGQPAVAAAAESHGRQSSASCLIWAVGSSTPSMMCSQPSQALCDEMSAALLAGQPPVATTCREPEGQAGGRSNCGRAAGSCPQLGSSQKQQQAPMPRLCTTVVVVGSEGIAATGQKDAGRAGGRAGAATAGDGHASGARRALAPPTGMVLLSKVMAKSCFMARPKEVRMPSGSCSATSWLTSYALRGGLGWGRGRCVCVLGWVGWARGGP